VSEPVQLLQANRDGGHGRSIVHSLACSPPAAELGETAAQGDQVAHAHQLLHLLRRQAQVNKELIQGHGLVPLRGVGEVGRHAHDHTLQLSPPVDHDLLAQQHARVKAAHLGDVQEALFDLLHHQRNLVHVPGQHHRWPWLCSFAALERDDVAQGIGARLVGVLPKSLAHNLSDLGLVPRRPARFCQLLQ